MKYVIALGVAAYFMAASQSWYERQPPRHLAEAVKVSRSNG